MTNAARAQPSDLSLDWDGESPQRQLTDLFRTALASFADCDDALGDNSLHDPDAGRAGGELVALAMFLPATETKLKATAGTGFRAPSLTQLYVNFLPFFVSNPDLKPETSFGYDFGFEQPLPAGRHSQNISQIPGDDIKWPRQET